MTFTRHDNMPSFSFAEGSIIRRLNLPIEASTLERSVLMLDIQTPYQPLEAPKGAVWPRATVRSLPLICRPGNSWAAKIWVAQDVPAKKNGRWITKTGLDLAEVMTWAALEVDKRRPPTHSAGPWGASV